MVTARIDLSGLNAELSQFKAGFESWISSSVKSTEAHKDAHIKCLRESQGEWRSRRPSLARIPPTTSCVRLADRPPPRLQPRYGVSPSSRRIWSEERLRSSDVSQQPLFLRCSFCTLAPSLSPPHSLPPS